jgi:prepilin-type N-terminal cleavage/methylation domain-containing protein
MRERRGFTLVEVLVSAALIVFIMLILSQAFITALTATRELKAAGDLQEKLRTVAVVLRNDLAADHFDTSPTGGPRLSLQDLTTYLQPSPPGWVPPTTGYFRIWQGSASTSAAGPQDWDEGTDGDGLHSFRSIDNMLQFTVRLGGNSRDNYLTALLPMGSPLGATGSVYGPKDYQQTDTYNGQFAEVTYYLRRAPGAPVAGSTPLYALFRRQCLILQDNGPAGTGEYNTANSSTPPYPIGFSACPVPFHDSAYYEMSCKQDQTNPAKLYFNRMSDVVNPSERFGMQMDPTGANAAYAAGVPIFTAGDPTPDYPILADEVGPTSISTGDDVLLTDVISFDVKALYTTLRPDGKNPDGSAGTETVDLRDIYRDIPQVSGTQNPALSAYRVFDTWSKNATGAQNKFDYSGWATAGSSASLPNAIHIFGLQITIRIWDAKTQRTRQISIAQQM